MLGVVWLPALAVVVTQNDAVAVVLLRLPVLGIFGLDRRLGVHLQELAAAVSRCRELLFCCWRGLLHSPSSEESLNQVPFN